MTPEEILEKLQKENPASIPVFKAMEEYAKQQCVLFQEWLLMFTKEFEDGDVRYWDGEKWLLKTSEELYDLFIKNKQC